MINGEKQHTIFNETADGTWTYTRQDQTSLPFKTLYDAESQENQAFGHQGTATYRFTTLQGKRQIQAHLNPFAD